MLPDRGESAFALRGTTFAHGPYAVADDTPLGIVI